MTAAADTRKLSAPPFLIVMLLIIVNICSFVKSIFNIPKVFLDFLNSIAHNITVKSFILCAAYEQDNIAAFSDFLNSG